MVVWLTRAFEDAMPSIVDTFISVELLDPTADPTGYAVVSNYMMHGPCGVSNPTAPCMKDGVCSKKFPKPFCPRTTTDRNGFVVYKRRESGLRSVTNELLDNWFVVPFNRDFIVKYQAHINVQICNHGNLMKYLFKYIHKGPDRAKAVVENHSDCSNTRPVSQFEVSFIHGRAPPANEIKAYLDCKYLSAYEAFWRLADFPNHERNPAVLRLMVHLPYQNPIYFKDNATIKSILDNPCSSSLFDKTWKMMANDIYYNFQVEWQTFNIYIDEDRVKSLVLWELQWLLERYSMSLDRFKLPLPSDYGSASAGNRLLNEQLNHDLNDDPIPHFVYKFGGTGKTFLYETITAKLRSMGFIVVAVASSRIPAPLLTGGTTGHSRFRIPIAPDKNATCDVKKHTNLAELIQRSSLIIWDEAPMTYRHCFEALNYTLNDLCLPEAE
ncbi:uncharacterized protein [Rutidosis leptorrhynchoides]|uniref:uncharacterized protein n=1 Tax=Rutidosis leptorrhynchoides TaxID=125765 RepID=UPI003A9A0AE6